MTSPTRRFNKVAGIRRSHVPGRHQTSSAMRDREVYNTLPYRDNQFRNIRITETFTEINIGNRYPPWA